jgi:hypothetical protein
MLWLAFACAPADSDVTDFEDTDIVEDRVVRPDPAPGIERWMTPEIVIPPYTEILYCWAGTFPEDVQGLASFEAWQGLAGHHVGLSTMPLGPDEMPDGTLIDCTHSGIPLQPLLNPLPVEPHHYEYALPDRMAIKVAPNSRWLAQLHYINTSGRAMRVQDTIDLGWRAPAEVDAWAASFGVPTADFHIPVGEEYTQSLDCHMGQDITVMWIAAHMHEHGSHYQLEIARADGSPRETLIDVDWTPGMRFDAPIVEPEGGLMLHRGDRITTSCTWKNDTDAVLTFPTEMCGAPGMVMPTERPVFCQP